MTTQNAMQTQKTQQNDTTPPLVGLVKGTSVLLDMPDGVARRGMVTEDTVYTQQRNGGSIHVQHVMLDTGDKLRVSVDVLQQSIITPTDNKSVKTEDTVKAEDPAVLGRNEIVASNEKENMSYNLFSVFVERLQAIRVGVCTEPHTDASGTGMLFQFYVFLFSVSIYLGLWRYINDEDT